MSFIQYNWAAIQELGDATQNASRNFDQDQQDLKSTIAPVQAELEGNFAQAYHAAQTKWNTSAADLNAILHDLGSRVIQAKEDMQATDHSAAKGFMPG